MYVFLVVLLVIIVILILVLKNYLSRNNNDYSYIAYETVMTKPEQILFDRLKKAYPQENYTIGYQVALNRLVKPKHPNNKKRFELSKKIGSKSIDFVITDLSSKLLFLIELDDNSYNNQNAQKRVLQKNKILENAGLKLYRFNVKSMPTVDELKVLLQNKEKSISA